MNGWMSKIAGGSMVILLLVAIFLGGYSSLLSHRLQLARQQAAEQQKTLAQQAGLITTLRTDDARNRAMMAEQQRREQQLRQQAKITRGNIRMPLKMMSALAASLQVLFLASCAERISPPPASIVLLPPESVFTPASNQNCRVKLGEKLVVIR